MVLPVTTLSTRERLIIVLAGLGNWAVCAVVGMRQLRYRVCAGVPLLRRSAPAGEGCPRTTLPLRQCSAAANQAVAACGLNESVAMI